jgi:putative transposase
VLIAYIRHFNEHRPHRALGQRPPLGDEQPLADVIDLDRLGRRDLLGGRSTSTSSLHSPQSS